MQLLPPVPLTAVKNSTGLWEIDWQVTTTVAVVLTKITITGPIGSTLNVYIDTTLIDATLRGDLNSNELIQPHVLFQGQMLRLIWSLGTGSAATATLMMQTYKDYR